MSPEWRRLDRRMILVDAVQAAGSLLLAVLAQGASAGWPLLVVATLGVLGAAVDAYRWAVTRYRVTPELVERRSGLLVRSHRSVRRDRIRSVDVHAKLRHRLGGLRIVKIGAGQQTAAGEAAFDLDAVSVADAQALQDLLLSRAPVPAAPDPQAVGDVEVLARFRPGWVVYNVLNVFAYVMAFGLLWGASWLLAAVGADPGDLLDGLVDALGTGWTIALLVTAVTLLGVVGLGVNFLVEYWGFELARVPTDDGGSALRTRHGLLTTREVSRDERRVRGVQISEPLPWRWMRVADTTVVTTGLSLWAISQPAAILPRGPLATARRVAAEALGASPDPLDAPLTPHPRAALRRRIGWATSTTLAVMAVVTWLAVTDVVPVWAAWATPALWAIAAGAAVIAYRALGHAIGGEHLVVRSGLTSRATTALQRSAVSTISVRESFFQRRLGLRTVSAMTSAGHGAYEAPDLDADEAITFAQQAAPGLLDPFVVEDEAPG